MKKGDKKNYKTVILVSAIILAIVLVFASVDFLYNQSEQDSWLGNKLRSSGVFSDSVSLGPTPTDPCAGKDACCGSCDISKCMTCGSGSSGKPLCVSYCGDVCDDKSPVGNCKNKRAMSCCSPKNSKTPGACYDSRSQKCCSGHPFTSLCNINQECCYAGLCVNCANYNDLGKLISTCPRCQDSNGDGLEDCPVCPSEFNSDGTPSNKPLLCRDCDPDNDGKNLECPSCIQQKIRGITTSYTCPSCQDSNGDGMDECPICSHVLSNLNPGYGVNYECPFCDDNNDGILDCPSCIYFDESGDFVGQLCRRGDSSQNCPDKDRDGLNDCPVMTSDGYSLVCP